MQREIPELWFAAGGDTVMADSDPNPVDHPTHRLVGNSLAMAALRAQIRHLAPFDTLDSPAVPTLLLRGATGTGKGLVARVIHDSGPRTSGPFIEVNCAAIPESMLEPELFGFEAGAFTDAKRAKPGLFEAASRGTLFLNEIGALPLVLQGKLLTALESKRVRRLGALTERAVDVKLIAATNAVLEQRIAAGHFRADLYHRLAVVVLALPPLRERGEDVLVLARRLLQQYTAARGGSPKRLSVTAEAWLRAYAWPGNVQELSHVMERVTLMHVGEEVDAETLRLLCPLPGEPAGGAATSSRLQELFPVEGQPAEAERIRQTLAQTGGNVARAARLLGVSRDSVRYRMQRYGIERPQLRTSSPPASIPPPRLGHGAPHPQGDGLPLEPQVALTGTPMWGPKYPRGMATRREAGGNAATDRDAATPPPVWAQKPVAVLAPEVTWPQADGPEPSRYNAWTEMARWDAPIMDRVHGFGVCSCSAQHPSSPGSLDCHRQWSSYPSGRYTQRCRSGRWSRKPVP